MGTYQNFVSIIVDVLRGNISTLATHDETLNIITNANEELTRSWTSGAADPKIQNELDYIGKEIASGDTADAAHHLEDLINEYMGSGKSDVDMFSQSTIAQMMGYLGACHDKLKNASGDISTVTAYNSIVQSKATNEEQIGQNLSKTEGSVLQQDASAQQPIADIGSDIVQILANIASLIQQTYS